MVEAAAVEMQREGSDLQYSTQVLRLFIGKFFFSFASNVSD